VRVKGVEFSCVQRGPLYMARGDGGMQQALLTASC
jgi:hypothetical protein